MYMNGVRTGMEITAAVLRPILLDRQLALTACFVVVAGTAARSTAECRIVSTAIPSAGATTTASA